LDFSIALGAVGGKKIYLSKERQINSYYSKIHLILVIKLQLTLAKAAREVNQGISITTLINSVYSLQLLYSLGVFSFNYELT
jgi:hypothetical protein